MNSNIDFEQRNLRIDFLRGISIFIVLIHHFNNAYDLSKSALASVIPRSIVEPLGRNGYYAVTLFFVISGYLITSMTLNRHGTLGKVNVIHFYVRRFARIFPSLFLFLVIVVITEFTPLSLIQHGSAAPVSIWIGVFSVVTFWHNVLMQYGGWFNYCLNILWSLSVEEVFYLFFPILCLSLKKERSIIFCWIGFVLLGPIYRMIFREDQMVGLYSNLACFDSIALGCLAAWFARTTKIEGKIGVVCQILASVVVVGVYFCGSVNDSKILGPTLISLATAVLLVAAHQKESFPILSKNKLAQVFCLLGKLSYELYLFHVVILLFMKAALPKEQAGEYVSLAWMIAYFLFSVISAQLIYQYFSEPINSKIRDYWKSAKIDPKFELSPSVNRPALNQKR